MIPIHAWTTFPVIFLRAFCFCVNSLERWSCFFAHKHFLKVYKLKKNQMNLPFPVPVYSHLSQFFSTKNKVLETMVREKLFVLDLLLWTSGAAQQWWECVWHSLDIHLWLRVSVTVWVVLSYEKSLCPQWPQVAAHFSLAMHWINLLLTGIIINEKASCCACLWLGCLKRKRPTLNVNRTCQASCRSKEGWEIEVLFFCHITLSSCWQFPLLLFLPWMLPQFFVIIRTYLLSPSSAVWRPVNL